MEMFMTKSIYIAGPMTGYEDFNFPAFNEAADILRTQGWTVFNPAEKESEKGLDDEARKTGDAAAAIEKGFDFREVYLWDVQKVIESDAILMLEGWEASVGAVGELSVAMAVKKHYPDYIVSFDIKELLQRKAA